METYHSQTFQGSHNDSLIVAFRGFYESFKNLFSSVGFQEHKKCASNLVHPDDETFLNEISKLDLTDYSNPAELPSSNPTKLDFPEDEKIKSEILVSEHESLISELSSFHLPDFDSIACDTTNQFLPDQESFMKFLSELNLPDEESSEISKLEIPENDKKIFKFVGKIKIIEVDCRPDQLWKVEEQSLLQTAKSKKRKLPTNTYPKGTKLELNDTLNFDNIRKKRDLQRELREKSITSIEKENQTPHVAKKRKISFVRLKKVEDSKIFIIGSESSCTVKCSQCGLFSNHLKGHSHKECSEIRHIKSR